MIERIKSLKNYWEIITISLITLIVKIPGLTWGFPGTMHNDESNLVRSSLGMRFGDLNPMHFDWPSFSFYFHYFFFWIFIKLRTRLQVLFGVEEMESTFPFWWGPELPFYYITRFLSIFLLGLVILMVYAIAMKITNGNKTIALISGLIFSIGYWTTYMSFYGLPESLMVLLFVLSLFFSIKIIENPSSISNYLIAAVFAGLATSTKYHGFLMCIVILAAHLINNPNLKSLIDRKLIYAGIVSIVAFFAGTPYAALDWQTFTITEDARGALWQITHMGKGLNWNYHLFETIPDNFGWVAATIGYYGLYLSLRSNNNAYKLNAISFLIILLYVGSWGITRAHYSLPLFPMFAIMIAIGLYTIKTKINIPTWKFILIVLLVIFPTAYRSTEEIIRYSREDRRVLAGRWIEENIPLNSAIEGNLSVTGIYGGNSPLFKYEDYTMLFPQYQQYSDRENYDERYIIFIADDRTELPEEYRNVPILYQSPEDPRTGPRFLIIEYKRVEVGN